MPSLDLPRLSKELLTNPGYDDIPDKSCCAKMWSIEGLWPLTANDRRAGIKFKMTAHTPSAEAAKWLDPQTWDDQPGSAFKEITFLGDCPASNATSPGEEPDFPETPGSGWNGAIKEVVEVKCGGGASTCVGFHNHLDFTSARNSDQFELDYGLCPGGSINGYFPPSVVPKSEPLDCDCGKTGAKSTGTHLSEIEATKNLVFRIGACDPYDCKDYAPEHYLRALALATQIGVCASETEEYLCEPWPDEIPLQSPDTICRNMSNGCG